MILLFFQIARKSKCPLFEIGMILLEPYESALWIANDTLSQFVWEVENLYPPNPYHNSSHGATVAHMTVTLATYLGIFNS